MSTYFGLMSAGGRQLLRCRTDGALRHALRSSSRLFSSYFPAADDVYGFTDHEKQVLQGFCCAVSSFIFCTAYSHAVQIDPRCMNCSFVGSLHSLESLLSLSIRYDFFYLTFCPLGTPVRSHQTLVFVLQLSLLNLVY